MPHIKTEFSNTFPINNQSTDFLVPMVLANSYETEHGFYMMDNLFQITCCNYIKNKINSESSAINLAVYTC